MGYVHTEITIRNYGDVLMAKRGLIAESEVHYVTVTAMVDSGAYTLAINEEMRKSLGLEISGNMIAELADGTVDNFPMTEAVDIHWKNRKFTCPALLLPNSSEALMGVLPLEGMDLMINPVKQELTGVHGDMELYKLKRFDKE